MKKNKTPKVSIITPTFNSEKFISETINSILNQTHTNWELLLTDDCSNDSTVEIINRFTLMDDRIKLFVLNKNSGAAVARNNSIYNSSGEYLAFCDSDDLWSKNKLESQINFMTSFDLSFCFTAYEIINHKGLPLNITVDSTQRGFFTYFDLLKKKATVGCCTVVIKKKSFEGLLEMPNIKTGQDYAFWIKLLKKTNHNAYVFPKILSKYRINPNSISRNKLKKIKSQFYIYKTLDGNNLVKSFYFLCYYAYNAIFRTS